MVGPARPLFVLFGSSIVQMSYDHGGWGAILSDIYSRRVLSLPLFFLTWVVNVAFKFRFFPVKLQTQLSNFSSLKADILLRGYFGWNSRRAVEVLDQVFPKDAAVQPSLVIVYFGGNDSMGPHSSGLGPHVPLPEYIDNMRKIASHVKSLSASTRAIFLSCPPVNEAIIRGNTSGIFSEIVRTNELCQQYSEACIKLCQEMDIKVVDLFTAFQKTDDWLNACFTDGIHLSAEGSKIVVEEILKVLREADWKPSLHWKSMPLEFAEDSPYDLVAADGKTTLNPSSWTFYREIQWD